MSDYVCKICQEVDCECEDTFEELVDYCLFHDINISIKTLGNFQYRIGFEMIYQKACRHIWHHMDLTEVLASENKWVIEKIEDAFEKKIQEIKNGTEDLI